MSIKSDLSLAYIMGYDDALAGRRPNSSKANVLASHPWAECHDTHEPTVEDVLREFAAEFVGMANHIDDHEVTDAIGRRNVQCHSARELMVGLEVR